MEIFILDIEGTNESILLNSITESEIDRSSERLNETLEQADLGIEPTIKNINGAYITSRNNAADYTKMYGWHFAKTVIADL